MKIALLGTAPSSMRKAPFGDPEWKIFGCSPGLYPFASRLDAWFELHRWEPPVIGKPDQQVPWFTPEYVAWMGQLQCPVWMIRPVGEVPNSRAIPAQSLVDKYGHFFFTSSLAWMSAMAIEAILENRQRVKDGVEPNVKGPDVIGYFGVDMAADEEQYTGQKAGCQFFATLAASMGIEIQVPPESDLMVPRPLYGLCEETHRHIKLLARNKELMSQKAQLEQAVQNATMNLHHVNGALDDMKYHLNTWVHEGEIKGTEFETLFPASRVAEAMEKKG